MFLGSVLSTANSLSGVNLASIWELKSEVSVRGRKTYTLDLLSASRFRSGSPGYSLALVFHSLRLKDLWRPGPLHTVDSPRSDDPGNLGFLDHSSMS